MYDLYAFLTGPALWFTFTVFLGGLAVRAAFLYGLSKERDRVFYDHMSGSWAARSILHWLVPWGSASMRNQPVFTLVCFVFHLCLLAVPIFLFAHNALWYEAFGVRIWSMSDRLADILTMVFLGALIFLLLRRLIRPEVRILTTAWDYTLLLLTGLPFLTGFLAYHQVGDYQTMMILHLVFAHLLLILIPFSKLGHLLLFFFSRAFIGVEMGGRRGARAW